MPIARQQSGHHEFGHGELGPIIAAFVLLLIREAERRKLSRLAFVARDGDLLREATQRLLHSLPPRPAPELVYIHLSRRATAPAALDAMDVAAVDAAAAVRAGPLTLAKVLEFHGLCAGTMDNWAGKHGLTLDTRISSPSMLRGLFADEQFRTEIVARIAQRKELLSRYIAQQGMGERSPTALVDIGWRGSIQTNLSRMLPDIAGLYFGLWTEDGPPHALPSAAIGLICDQRRDRSIREGAAWYAAHLLEAICRAPEGTTLGYNEEGGRIVPVLETDTSRSAEIETAEATSKIRAGILDRIEQLAKDSSWSLQSDGELRRAAQDALFQLAFFPGTAAIAIGKTLVHTEGHASGWSVPLIASVPDRPFASPRQWLAGLASPWRAGYVCATGGKGLAWLFAGTEALLVSLSPKIRHLVSSLARRLAGLPSARR